MRSGNYTYFVETYGCQMNKAESEALEGQLADAGWSPATDSTKADLIILNTCSVRKTAENRIYGRIGHYKHMRTQRNFKLAVIGCMSERLKDQLFNECQDIDIIVGSFQKHRLVDILEEAVVRLGHPLETAGHVVEGALAVAAASDVAVDHHAQVHARDRARVGDAEVDAGDPQVGVDEILAQVPSGDVGELLMLCAEGLAQLLAEQPAYVGCRQMQGGRDDVRGPLLGELHQVFAQVSRPPGSQPHRACGSAPSPR